MEAEIARRRVSTIAGHLFAGEDVPATHQHILPMNCSGSLNSVVGRRDNKVMFARQGSGAQTCFMKQASPTDQAISSAQPAASVRRDNKLLFARQGSGAQACFMRQASPTDQTISSAQLAANVKRSGSEGSCNAIGSPSFSRPVRMDVVNLPRMSIVQPAAPRCNLNMLEPPPQFGRPGRGISVPQKLTSKNKVSPPVGNGIGWSPRMDVAESMRGYVLTVEIPGVGAKDIRVEVNERNLVVVGKRSVQSRKAAGLYSNSISAYHKREIQQGPYQVVWPLPNGVNKDRISAELKSYYWSAFEIIAIRPSNYAHDRSNTDLK